jgi:muconolactone D-isomerase
MVEMDVRLPADLPAATADALKADEKALCHELQRQGRWRHIWRVAGRYSNVSIFDVDTPEELHEIMSGLPLFPYMDTRVTALSQHPSVLPEA